MQHRIYEKNEDYTSIFIEEVKKIEKGLEEAPIRPIPRRVTLADVKLENNIRSGVKEERGNLLISRDLSTDKMNVVMKREAFTLFLPQVDFPQVYDLAWAYANADPKWWSKCTSEVNIPTMPRYFAPEVLQWYKAKNRWQVIKSITKALLFLYKQHPDKVISLKDYLTLTMIAMKYPSVRMSKRELIVLKSLVHAIRLGGAKLESLSKYTGLSLASISRALRDLISKGVIYGPYVIYLPKMNLSTYLMELKNPTKDEIEFLENFPYTYTTYVTLRNVNYIYFLIPSKYENVFSQLNGREMRLGKAEGFSFDLHSLATIEPEEVLGLMASGYNSAQDTPLEWREIYRSSKPPIKLDKADMLALSAINSRGKASRTYLHRIGVPNAAERFAKYKKHEIIVKGYYPAGVGLGEALLVRLNLPYKDLLRVRAAFSSVSSPIIFFTSGGLVGMIAIIFANEHIIGTVMKSIRILFKDHLEKIDYLLSIGPSNWQLPIDLWNEEEQSFEMNLDPFIRTFSPRLGDELSEKILRRLP